MYQKPLLNDLDRLMKELHAGVYPRFLEENDGSPLFAMKALYNRELANQQSYVYVLRLRNDKLYVGQTCDIRGRMVQHSGPNGGCVMTRTVPPVELISIERGSVIDERHKTLRLMAEHGVENVRGSDWSNRWLTADQLWEIESWQKIFGYHQPLDKTNSLSGSQKEGGVPVNPSGLK